MEKGIKSMRVHIDGIIQLCESEGVVMPTTFRNAQWELLKAKGWLGELLGAIGTISPYPKDGTRHSVKDIEPIADTSTEFKAIGWDNKNQIEKIDYLRQEIGEIKRRLQALPPQGIQLSREGAIARTNAWSYLCEARHWLGHALAQIREQAKN